MTTSRPRLHASKLLQTAAPRPTFALFVSGWQVEADPMGRGERRSLVPAQRWPLATRLHRAASCLAAFPLAAGGTAVVVGVAFLMDARGMWEVLCR